MRMEFPSTDRLPRARDIERSSVQEWGGKRTTAIIGQHAVLAEALEKVTRFASSHSPVLVSGETGTGKELFARALYLSASHHRRTFVSINCAQYCGTELLASELFGHCRGAFTGAHADHRGIFEEADRGTVFLDEIGDLPLPAQAMLLRTLSEGEVVPVGGSKPRQVDVRLIAATHRDLKAMIAAGKFRSDLYYRLRQLTLVVPPLRERGDDWRLIANHYLEQLCARAGVVKRFSPRALRVLESHFWPGNVREVRSVVDTSFHLSADALIEAEDLAEALDGVLGDEQLDRVAGGGVVEDLCEGMLSGTHDFWSAVHRPFLDRELNRAQVRDVVSEGLQRAHGSYKRMLDVFGIEQGDYLKLMDFLRHHALKPEPYQHPRRARREGGR